MAISAWYHLRVLLLLFGVVIAPLLATATSSSIDYESLSWSKWNDIYTDSVARGRVYRNGPRVRAKILVSTHLSMNDFQTGAAIFRHQIREIVDVETIDRVQIEFLQTDACSETEQGAYYVALGISALFPPTNFYPSALILPAIEAERVRIVQNLKYGKVLATGNLTIESLTLFGAPMNLVDIVFDGETFVQINLKAWVGVQLAIASADSVITGVISSNDGHYTMNRDAFQDLRLRFLLAQRLEFLHVRVSDLIVSSPTNLLPFTMYKADVGVLEIEVHVHNLRYAEFVEMTLLDANKSSNGLITNVIADFFHDMEPQWQLIAMDVDIQAGKRFSPVSSSQGSVATVASTIASELTFEIHNIPLTQLKRSKWSVLDFMRVSIAHIVSSQVRFSRIGFPSSSFALSSLSTDNDGDGTEIATEDGFTTDSVFDPINAVNWTLGFKVEPQTTGTFSSTVLESVIIAMQSLVETGLQHALDSTGATDTSMRSVTFLGAHDWDFDLHLNNAVEPFVDFTLTIQVEPLDASGTVLESPNFFQLHHVRSALVLLLQQVAITNDKVLLVSVNTVDSPTMKLDKSGHTWHRLLFFKYRAIISDESQRRGIRTVIFSRRLASTISTYSDSTLELIERHVDLHVDGSPCWPQYFPGLFVAVPVIDSVSDGFITSSTSLLKQQKTFVYDFNDPEPSAASGILLNAADVCNSGGTASTSQSGLCFRLRFTGMIQFSQIFLRTLQSLHPIAASSIKLPHPHAPLELSISSHTHPAPWILIGDQNEGNDTVWTFLLENPSTAYTFQSIRLTFVAVETMQDLNSSTPFTLDLKLDPEDLAAAPVIRRRQFGDVAVVATSDQPAPAFLSAEHPQLRNDGDKITNVNVTLNVQEPRLGGLYSASILNEIAPVCIPCTAFLSSCNSRLECRAFSACASVLLDSDLTLISRMLQEDAAGTSIDASWLLEDCISPSDGTVWSSTMREMLVSSCTCLWRNHCPLAHSDTLSRQLILDYNHGEQVLEFELVNGFASLSFTLDTGERESTYEFVEDFNANTTDVTPRLIAILTDMYRAALSNVATIEATLRTTEDAVTGVVTAHLTIQYLFLGRLPLPLVEITQSGNRDASVDVTALKETLQLRVVPVVA